MLFNKNRIDDFKSNYHYLEVDRSREYQVDDLLVKGGIMIEKLNGSDHTYYGFYLEKDMKSAQTILEVFGIKSVLHRHSEIVGSDSIKESMD